ncbi:MAG: HYR domain-containing protein, partial [Saprospiraceae bacterium]
MKKFQYFLLLVLFALPLKSFAQPFVQFTAQSSTIDCTTSSLSIDIEVTDFIQMNAFDYSFHWDPTVLTLTSIDDPGIIPSIVIGQNGAATGGLTFSWFSVIPAGNTIPDGTLVTLNFDLIGNASQTSGFTFDNIPTFINIAQYGMSLDDTQYTLTDGSLTITDTTDPTITCPAGPLTFDTGGATTTQITGAAPTANDNCDIDFISYELTMNGTNVGVGTGDVSNNVNFEIGTTTVTYTANDFGGNTETCSFDVVVTNNSAPTMMTISMDNNLQVNCEDNTASFNIYADAFNNIRGGQFTIAWPISALQYIDTSNYAITVGNTAFGTTNISNGQLVWSWNHSDEISLPNGTILFTIEFNITSLAGLNIPVTFLPGSDEFTNNASTVFPFLPISPSEYSMVNGSIYVFDAIDPTITCPANVSVISVNGTDAIVNGIAPTTADNCGIMSTTYILTDVATSNNIGNGTGDASGTTFPIGTTNVEYTVTDFDGNQATCNFDVTVTVPGVITVSVDSIQVNCETGTATIGLPVENFIDVIGLQFTIEWDPTKLEFVSIVEDNFDPDGTPGLGQVANGNFNFSWFDTNNPTTFQNGENILVLEFNILDQTVGNDYDFNFINAPTPYSVITQSSFPGNDPTAISEPGNIEIIDNTDPIITCPVDVTVNSTNGTDAIVNGIAPTVTDNCGTMSTTYVLTNVATSNIIGNGTDDASGTTFPIGTTNVEYTVTDFGGNQATCNFNVTVQNQAIITVNVDSIQVNCETGTALIGLPVENFMNVIGVQFTLEWDPTKLGFVSVAEDNFTPDGITGLGQVGNGQFNFSWFDSNNPANFNDGDNIIVLEFNILDQTAGNDYDINFINAPVPFSVITQSSFPLNDPTAISEPGNIEIIDNTDPEITCPADITVNSTNGINAIVNGIAPIATDNCGTPTISYVILGAPPTVGSGDASGNTFLIGTTMVTYTATDQGGNSVSCSFNVTVNQDQLMIECPMNVNQGTDANVCSATLDLPVIILSDPNNINTIFWSISGASGPASGAGNISNFTFSLGTSTIIYSVTDNFGGSETCSFQVTITDQEGPVISGTPADTTVECDNIPLIATPTATDQCDGVTNVSLISESITAGPTPGSFIITRTWATIDAAGNISTASQNITVIDTTAPTITCPADISTNPTTSPLCGASVSWTIPTASDNCDPNVQVTSSFSPNDFFPLGTTVVTYYAEDNSGNIDSCKFNVTVSDVELPVFTNCPTDMTVSSGIACDTIVTWTVPTVTDNCDNNVNIVAVPALGTAFPVGTTTVTYTATDASGNVANCSFDITVADTEAPVLTDCPIDMTLSSGSDCSTSVIWNMPTVADNCDANPTLTCNIPSGNTFSVGTTPIICTATDASGNTSTCTFNVTVIDTLAPSVFCPIDVTISTNGDIVDANSFEFIDEISTTPLGCDSVIVFFNNPAGNDNCGIPTITSTGIESGDTLEVGQHIIQFTAMDGSGNVNTVLCETTITITSFVGLDVTASPDTVCTGGNTQLFANLFTPVSTATYSWTGPNPSRIITPSPDPIIDNITLDDAGTYIVTVTN